MNFKAILNNIITFILALYGDFVYPRKIVQEVIEYFNNFIQNYYLPSLKHEIITMLKETLGLSDTHLSEIEKCFDKYSNVFEDVLTEYKRFKLLKTKGFIDYEEFKIGYTFIYKAVGTERLLVPEYMYGIYVPLRKSLKLFLEIPGMFNQILTYIDKLSKEKYVISNIMQGNLWLKNYATKFGNDLVLPLFLFYDDLEVGEALGSHAGINKFGALYASIACLPPHIASRLSSIIFSTLVRTEDKKKCKNKKVFAKVIEEINFLQKEGITINVDGITRRVKFQLVLILGDNLGLNGIFGLVESFKAHFSCRICKISSKKLAYATTEDQNELRTRENYEKDSENCDVSSSGIKEPCAFHDIKDFHITQNLSIDMMHDLLEGVCVYVMRSIIYEFIFNKKYFSLDYLNYRIQNFKYGPSEISNKPPVLALHRIKKKINLKISASEMLCLVRYFGLIIGDMIPETDESWELYKYLRQILDIVTSPRIIRSDAKVLKILIMKLNQLYVDLFETLKPKFHNLLHYPRILLENGPCIHYWSMRFESCHRQIKATAKATSCNINLLVTIATKQILKMCEMLHNLATESMIKLSSLNKGDKTVRSYFPTATETLCYNQADVCGYSYKNGMFIVTDMSHHEKMFGKILKIVEVDKELFFIVRLYEEIIFDEHCHAYVVNEKKNETKVFKYADLPNVPPCLSVVKNKERFIATRHAL